MNTIIFIYFIGVGLTMLFLMVPPALLHFFSDAIEIAFSFEERTKMRKLVIDHPYKYFFTSVVVSLCWFTMLPGALVIHWMDKKGKSRE